jgi:hypothetical protein
MAGNIDVSGAWQIKQENGFLVDLRLWQDGNQLSGNASHSGGRVTSNSVTGTVNGEKVVLTIPWSNGTRGRYTSWDHLAESHFTGPYQGILKGDAFDEVNPHVTTTWESMKSFYRVG